MCCTWLTDNKGCKNLPSEHHCATLLGCIFTTKACINNWKKNLLNCNISSTCPLNMVMSLNGGQPNFARCLAISWASTLFIHFWGSCPLMKFCQVENSLCVQVLRCPIVVVLLHGTQAEAGRPSRWASAHILVVFVNWFCLFFWNKFLFLCLSFSYLILLCCGNYSDPVILIHVPLFVGIMPSRE